MDTRVAHNGVEIDLMMYEVPVKISGRGWVHHARLLKSCPSAELDKLIGLELWGCKVLGVEKFASMHQNAGVPIGLLLEKQLWSGK